MPASAHFVLSFTKAMTDQLSDLLAELEPAPLTPASLDQLERLPGVYELLQEGSDGVRRVMYVGKADRSLPDRLADHFRKISARHNIDIRDMYFVCAYVERDLHAVAPEAMLIDHRRRAGDAPWNGRVGFGPHDPGRERDTQDPPPWDLEHPIRIDDVLGFPRGEYDLTEYLYALKDALPFLFRFERVDNRRGSGHPDYEGLTVRIPADLTARELLVFPSVVLPVGWRVTILPGYAIMYKNRPRSPVTYAEYESGPGPGRRAGFLDRR
ncbi:Eco29kI family restriction endonuclease [Janibacter sp. CX7]|uniref:Eco29kI family restriction endonuclease n=1 Tax=Janibacter sp. CX7 TaxID=2963431 RepID=UPI0020CD82DD|nr:Eco29kI family restriction endonuclease [Janibacter sp. CX7]UTT65243.1 Eco29kI family restriction endonuclease [Janibacter sp. CX7]